MRVSHALPYHSGAELLGSDSEILMRSLLLLLSLVLPVSGLATEGDREVAKKEVTLMFPSVGEAGKWKLNQLGFERWIELVAEDSWKCLTKLQTSEFYFAAFRFENHLILCNLPIKGVEASSGQGVEAVDGSSVWVAPSKWAKVVVTVKYPTGGIQHTYLHSAFEIKEGFSGPMIVRQSVKNDDGGTIMEIEEEVAWD